MGTLDLPGAAPSGVLTHWSTFLTSNSAAETADYPVILAHDHPAGVELSDDLEDEVEGTTPCRAIESSNQLRISGRAVTSEIRKLHTNRIAAAPD